MIVGVPREIKNEEYRVAMTPNGVKDFVRAGHKVIVEAGAGTGSGFSDREYKAAGAELGGDSGDPVVDTLGPDHTATPFVGCAKHIRVA